MQRFLLRVIISFIVIAGIVGVFAYTLITRPFPDYNSSVTATGISAPTEIYRDEFAIPHIIATNDNDAAFALGYVHAEDRLWQMDFWRHAAGGRLSEIFGDSTRSFDVLARVLSFTRRAHQAFEQTSAETKTLLTSYALGVNAYRKKKSSSLPIEFNLLNYIPREWTAEDCLLIDQLMSWECSSSLLPYASFTVLSHSLGSSRSRLLFPFPVGAHEEVTQPIGDSTQTPAEIRLKISDLSNDALLVETLGSLNRVERAFRNFLGMSAVFDGSAWTATQEHTHSSLPLLGATLGGGSALPSLFYEAHLATPLWNAAGVTIPGMPGFFAGRSLTAAWSFVPTFVPNCEARIISNDSSRMFEVRNDSIQIYNSSTWPCILRFTSHGIVASDALEFLDGPDRSGGARVVEFSWNSSQVDEIGLRWRAQTARAQQDFDALATALPATSTLLVATVANKFALYSTTYPAFTIANPPSHFIAAAHNDATSEKRAGVASGSATVARLETVLSPVNPLTTADARELTTDIVSPHAHFLIKTLVALLDSLPSLSANEQQAMIYLRNWDGTMRSQDVAPLIFATWLANVYREILGTKVPHAAIEEYLSLGDIPARTLTHALATNSFSSLWDDQATQNFVETPMEIFHRALAVTLGELRARYGDDLRRWQWGEQRVIQFTHPLHNQLRGLARITDSEPISISGNSSTVSSFDGMRMVTSLADSTLFIVIPSGICGQPMTSHYDDQLPRWRSRTFVSISLNNDALARTPDFHTTIFPR